MTMYKIQVLIDLSAGLGGMDADGSLQECIQQRLIGHSYTDCIFYFSIYLAIYVVIKITTKAFEID